MERENGMESGNNWKNCAAAGGRDSQNVVKTRRASHFPASTNRTPIKNSTSPPFKQKLKNVEIDFTTDRSKMQGVKFTSVPILFNGSGSFRERRATLEAGP